MFLTKLIPDLTESKRLLAAGMKLVKLHPYTKQPIGNDWNKNFVNNIDDDATGYGIPLAVNELCSVDLDHAAMAKAGLKAWGFDLDELLNAGVRTLSTRPDSGGRATFAADPEGITRWLTLSVTDENGKNITVLELRTKSTNLQDVVPGIVYSNKDGQEFYSQYYVNGRRFDDAPHVPEQFLNLWRILSTDDNMLREYTNIFIRAIKDAGFNIITDEPAAGRDFFPVVNGNVTHLAFPAKGIRTEYNKRNSVESILARHGYTYHEHTGRWARPRATGAPAIRPIPGKTGLWHSDHGGDPLHGTFDAWTAHVHLDHHGDVNAAIAAMGGYAQQDIQELMDQLRMAEPDEARRMVPDILRRMEELPEIDRIDWHKQIRDVMHWNAGELKNIIKDLRRNWTTVSHDETDTKDNRFDPYRYIYIAPRNEFYDIRSGMVMIPKGLDNKYIRETGEETASRIILMTMPPELAIADRLGWNPVGAEPPPRDNIIYEDEGQRIINTWRGFALTPTNDDVTPWLEHAKYLVPNEREREVLLNYMAAMVQRIDSKPSFAIIHRGYKRNGKDSFYAPVAMFMGSAAKEVTINDVLESWGDYRYQTKFLIVTEVKRSQDHNVSNAMKTMVAPTMTGKQILNLKGGQVVMQPDYMGVLMMTNHRSGFTIDPDDPRYFVIDSWVQPREPEYYTDLYTWYRHGGAAAILGYLLKRDISGFNHNVLPFITEGAREMAQSSRYDYEQDLEDMINEGQPPFDKGIITNKILKAQCRLHNLRVGNNGLNAAMEQLGWKKVRGVKKVDGKTVATPTFYISRERAEQIEMTSSGLYDLYQSLAKTILSQF